jgi:hypothetical protein
MIGRLTKMKSERQKDVIQYRLNINDTTDVNLNELIGNKIEITFLNKISCINCNKVTKKSWGEGLCYDCYMNAPGAAPCIIRPELCEAHLGKGRDANWENSHHNQPHTVYLALTSNTKVGVTRETQIPTRWIDQGAWKVIRFALTPYRQLAGKIEVELKQFLSDKTDWRKMLTNQISSNDLIDSKKTMASFLSNDFTQYIDKNDEVMEFKYPVLKYPETVSSLSFDKTEKVEGILTGVRGQYLYLNNTEVLNIRSHSGYHIEFNY